MWGRWGLNSSFKGTKSPMTQLPPTRPHLLKILPLPKKQRRLGDKGLWGIVKIQTRAIIAPTYPSFPGRHRELHGFGVDHFVMTCCPARGRVILKLTQKWSLLEILSLVPSSGAFALYHVLCLTTDSSCIVHLPYAGLCNWLDYRSDQVPEILPWPWGRQAVTVIVCNYIMYWLALFLEPLEKLERLY
jgi:hypothetical protein